MFPEGEKTISNGLIYQDRGLEAYQQKQANIKCIRSLIWAGLNSEY